MIDERESVGVQAAVTVKVTDLILSAILLLRLVKIYALTFNMYTPGYVASVGFAVTLTFPEGWLSAK